MSIHPDYMRSLENIFDPDPRSSGFEMLGEKGRRPITLRDQHAAIAPITLHDDVPPTVILKFETAKNLSLFSWFVYWFHSAARSHVYECLELALRTRFGDELYALEERQRRERHEQSVKDNPHTTRVYQPTPREKFRPTMRPLLRYAIEIGTLRNEGFSAWHAKTKARARSRRDIEMVRKMTELGITELQTDDIDIEITAEDRDHDYLGQLLEDIPLLRNQYAHGTSALDHRSLNALRVASEVINQIFRSSLSRTDGEPQER